MQTTGTAPLHIPNQAGTIKIASLKNNVFADIDVSILNVSVDYSIDAASQLSFDVIETVNVDYSRVSQAEKTFITDLEFAKNNYFQIGREVVYETNTIAFVDDPRSPGGQVAQKISQIFEIANVTISQGPGGSPVWNIKCYTKAIQQMKRDRQFSSITGSGTAFVRRAAQRYGLKFWGQETSKKVSITKASGDKQADSLWDVLTRLAGEAKFVIFEVNGFLIFASEEYLLYKWGIDSGVTYKFKNPKTKQDERRKALFIPLQYPYVTVGRSGYFYAMEYPTITVSDNDPRHGDGSIIVDRANGTQIRPGMTAYIGNVPGLNGYYLITSVSFADRTPDPVTVSFRKPTKEPKEIKQLAVGERYLATGLPSTIPTLVSPKNGAERRQESLPGAIIPLPTSSAEFRYPRSNSISTSGNVPLYNRPVLNVNGVIETIEPFVIFQKANLAISSKNFAPGDTAVVIGRIWTVAGSPVRLTEAQAKSKYLSDGLHYGKFSSDTDANNYIKLLTRQQVEVLKKRFPTVSLRDGQMYPVTAGST